MNSSYPVRNDHITEQQLGEEILLYTSENESVHVLNGTAGFIWKLCDGKHSLADIEKELLKRYELNPDQDVIQDVINVVDDFKYKGLM